MIKFLNIMLLLLNLLHSKKKIETLQLSQEQNSVAIKKTLDSNTKFFMVDISDLQLSKT